MIDSSTYLDSSDYRERVYSGVLGKIIGVYLGRPVEGWPYEDISDRFPDVSGFLNTALGLPLIVADDDISASFTFIRSGEDFGIIDAESVANTWLNYILENQTVLWWGGLGRSTEHTALLRLKSGVRPGKSGSISLNGPIIAEQIGAQIFNDAFSMLFPLDPEASCKISRTAASVSHDGVALDITGFLAAMRSLAFSGGSVPELITKARPYAKEPLTLEVIDTVTQLASKKSSWREARQLLDHKYGYSVMPGPCHSISNFAMVMMALLYGKNSFIKSVAIACAAALDSDSNAGLVGMINGIRLGLKSVSDSGLRTPVADRAVVVTSDGGECVTDAVRETRRIFSISRRIHQLPTSSHQEHCFDFPFEGSVQGFESCPYMNHKNHHLSLESVARKGLLINSDSPWAISTPTFLEPRDSSPGFSTIASPTLYPSQIVNIECEASSPFQLYVLFDTPEGIKDIRSMPYFSTKHHNNTIKCSWEIPAFGNYIPFRVGISSDSASHFRLRKLDWSGAPSNFHLSGVLQTTIWDLKPKPLQYWVSSAHVFEADFSKHFAMAENKGDAVATIGTRDWLNYCVQARLQSYLFSECGLVAYSRGHRNYYSLALTANHRLEIRRTKNGATNILASANCSISIDVDTLFKLELHGGQIKGSVTMNKNEITITCEDHSLTSGSAGIYVKDGSVAVDDFDVSSQSNTSSPEQ